MKRTVPAAVSLKVAAVVGMVLCICVTLLYGQSSDNYILTTSVLDESGGSPESTNNKMVASSAGQPTPIGVSESPNYIVYAGYIYTLEIECVDPPEIVEKNLTDGNEDCPYAEVLEVEPGTGTRPLTWKKIEGSFPPGVTLDNATGEISGTPRKTDTYNFVVQVTDACAMADTQDFSITINPYEDIKGDVNGDCSINVVDVVKLTNCCILDRCPCTEEMRGRGDINGPPGNCDGDGSLNVLDSIKLVNLILEIDECP